MCTIVFSAPTVFIQDTKIELMIKLFYKIWVDIIAFEKSVNTLWGNWVFYTLMPMTFLLALNIGCVYMFFALIFGVNPLLYLNNVVCSIGVNSSYSWLIAIVLSSLGPSLFINYWLIFYKKKYLILSEKYQVNGELGKYAKRYFIVSTLFYFILGCIIQ